MSVEMEQRLKAIKGIALDIDGVFTDGSLIPLADGDLLRVFDTKDSFAVRFACQQGYVVGIISGGNTNALRLRMLNLGIKPENIHLGCRGKLAVFKEYCRTNGLTPEEVAYFGDDIADIQVLRACGIGIVPSDAAEEAKDAADIISEYPGGKHCVRKGIEAILKAQGKWVFDDNSFEKFF